jgi:signal transduction histidine kinase
LFERYGDIRLLTDKRNSIMDGTQFSLQDKIQYLQSVERAYGVYSAFSIYGANGTRLGNTHDFSVGKDDSAEEFFKVASKGLIYYDPVPVYSNDTGKYELRFAGPLHNNSGKVAGVLVASVPLAAINDIVAESASGIDSATANLVSPSGLIIYSSLGSGSTMHQSLSNLQVYQRMVSSGNQTQHVISNEPLGGQDNQAIYVAVKEAGFLDFKGNGWILILAVPTNVAFHVVNQLRVNFVLLAAIILGASIGAVVIFSRVFTKPLIELKNAAVQIAGGNFEIRAKIHQNDEIGELSEQFDKMRSELKDRERTKDEFINIAAHELRSPLQPIISYDELALKGLMDKDEALKVIDSEARRFIQLANDILDVSRIGSGAISYQMQMIKLKDVLERVIELVRASGKMADGVLLLAEFDNASKELEIEGDRNRLVQVFTNIIGNAAKFTKQGTIKIEALAQQDTVEIRISDTGGGIPEEILPKLFGRFVTKSVKGGTEHGTGLGLYISKAIINAHGGEIRARNNESGGATFTVILPVKKRGTQKNHSPSLPADASRRLN